MSVVLPLPGEEAELPLLCIRTYLSFRCPLGAVLGVVGGAFLRKFQNGEHTFSRAHTQSRVCAEHNAEVGCGKIRSQFRIATVTENYVTFAILGKIFKSWSVELRWIWSDGIRKKVDRTK